MKPYLTRSFVSAILIVVFPLVCLGEKTNALPGSVTTDLGRSLILPSRFDGVYISVPVQIGTEGPFNLIIDTGTTYMALSSKAVERLRRSGEIAGRPKMQSVITLLGKRDIPVFDLRNVQLGDLVVKKTFGLVMDMGVLGHVADMEIDGVAGMELFQNGTLTIDYPGKEIRFGTNEIAPEDRTILIPCDFPNRLPLINVEIAGQKFQAMIDSGASEGFYVPTNLPISVFESSPAVYSLAVTGGGITEMKGARLAKDLQWGGITFARPIVDISENDEGIIGVDVLEYFVASFDQVRRKVGLTPRRKEPVVYKSISILGFNTLPSERGLKVVGVFPKTDAERAGIRPEDQISAINGKPAKEWTQEQLAELAYEVKSFEVELVSDPKPKRIEVKVTTLFE